MLACLDCPVIETPSRLFHCLGEFVRKLRFPIYGETLAVEPYEAKLPDTIQALNASVRPPQSGGFPPSGIQENHPMTTKDPSDLEPIKPERAQELYLDHKASECREITVQSHKYRTNHFVRWCQENGIDNLNEISGRNLHEFRLWREDEGDLNKVSLETQMCSLRVFLKY